MINEEDKKVDADFFESIEKEESGISLDESEDLNKAEPKQVTQEVIEDKKEEAQDEKPEEKSEPVKEPGATGTSDEGNKGEDIPVKETPKADETTTKSDGETGKESTSAGTESSKAD